LWWCDVVVVIVIAAGATTAVAVDNNVVGVVFVVVVFVVVDDDFVDVVFVAAGVVSNWNNDRKWLILNRVQFQSVWSKSETQRINVFDMYCHCLYDDIVWYSRYLKF